MEKKLPGVFANKIDKSLNNNEEVYYSVKNEVGNFEKKREFIENESSFFGLNVNQKINNIFNSRKYVYKADVSIKTKDGVFNKRIIGKNSTHLITMDNELIPISNIIDIDFSE